ncbi:MAG TPA: YceI family protein [Mycobacteriales bacterium]|nr:YceI family protein [Mycobacteriales bacterium]
MTQSAEALTTRTGTWTIDPTHSSLDFTVRHAMVAKVRGRFTDFTGTLRLDDERPERSSAEVAVQLASVDTGNPQRDEHLRTGDFFEVETFPTMTFVSTDASARGDDGYSLTGDLTIHGVTKPVRFDVTLQGTALDPFGNERIGFEGSTTISRKDWGLTWNAPLEAGAGVLVSDKVAITLDVSAIRQQ